MKKLFITIIIVLVSIFNIQAQEKIKIAVMDFAVGTGVEESIINGLSEALTKSLSKTGKFTISEREQLYRIINEQEPKQFRLNTKQITNAGKILGVKSVLTGFLSYSEKHKTYDLDIKIIDIDSGEVIYTIAVTKNESEASNKIYRKLMPGLAKKISWKLTSPPIKRSVENVTTKPDAIPSFPGGERALNQYLGQNIRYPAAAMEKGIQGKVICQFVIKDDGSIVDIEVIRSVDADLDKEAIRVIKEMPKWEPGTQDGKPANVIFTFPVNFRWQGITRIIK